MGRLLRSLCGLLLLAGSLGTVLLTPSPTFAATETLRPNAAGDECTITDQAGAACPNHYQNVDEVVADEDSTMVSNYPVDAWNQDLYNVDDHAVGAGIINNITVYARAKDGLNSGDTLKIVIKSGSTVSEGATKTITTSYANYSQEWSTNPATSSAFTWSEIDSLQIGVKIRGMLSVYEPRVTQIWVVVDYTIDAPTVTTQACTNVEATTATGNGNITATGGENATRRGFCYMTGTSGDPTTANSVAYDDGSFGTGAYTKGLTGLSAGTSYRVRAYAVNSVGTGYGATVQMQTWGVPIVTTSAASNITGTTATLNGNITSLNGPASASERGFDWDTDSGEPYTNEWTEQGTFGTGTFSRNIASLGKGVLYYVRAKALNSVGWGFGAEVLLLTKPDPPYGVTAAVTGNGIITLGWTNGAGAQTTYIRGKAGSYPTSRTDGYEVYSGSGVTVDDTGRTGGVTYYYRLWSYVTEGGEQQYSDTYAQVTCVALSVPVMTTSPAQDIGTTIATLAGAVTATGGTNLDIRAFVWDTVSRGNPGNVAPAVSGYSDNATEGGTFGVGSFTHFVDTLSGSQTYYVRAAGHNSTGWAYGAEVTFDTYSLVLWFQPTSLISGTTLPNRAGGNNGVITWGSNPAGISDTLIAFEPAAQARAPDYAVNMSADWLPDLPTLSSNFTTTVDPTFPGKSIIDAIAAASDTPAQLPYMIMGGFGILAVSITTSWALRRFGAGASAWVKVGVIAGMMGILIAVKMFDFWMLLFFGIISIALVLVSRHR